MYGGLNRKTPVGGGSFKPLEDRLMWKAAFWCYTFYLTPRLGIKQKAAPFTNSYSLSASPYQPTAVVAHTIHG